MSEAAAQQLKRVERTFFSRSALEVAPALLGKLFTVGSVTIRVTETEAYLQDDPASHSYSGVTNRNRVMFGPAGILYVYFTYGMHWCANVVTGGAGDGQAVLLRAGLAESGHEIVSARRPGRQAREWTNGPAKLAKALDLDGRRNGVDLCSEDSVGFFDDNQVVVDVEVTPRIGISKAKDLPQRFLYNAEQQGSSPKPG